MSAGAVKLGEAMILKILDAALTAAAVGIEREAILAQVTQLQAAGATADDIAAELVRMREAALANLEGKLGGPP